METLKYRAEIDGLRAIAIIPVVLFHLGYTWIPGGFMGVDVFFVISGYLITALILKEYEKNTFRFSNFWLRRIKRIFPALVFMILIMTIVGSYVYYGQELNNLGLQSISAILSFANITMWRLAGNYWGQDANNSLFLHTWSLSVEEQFYFFYPFVLMLLLKKSKKNLVMIIGALALGSFLLYIYGNYRYPFATFYLLPTRAWELASGCLIGILLFNQNQYAIHSKVRYLPLLGLFLIIFSYIFYLQNSWFIYYLIFPVIGSVLIIAFSSKNDFLVSKLLATKPFVFIGKISYSLYLWHWAIIVLMNHLEFMGGNSIPFYVTTILISLTSLASYYFIETPTRKMKNILSPAIIMLVVSFSFSYYLFQTKHKYDFSVFHQPQWKGKLYSVNPKEVVSNDGNLMMEGVEEPTRDPKYVNAYNSGGIIKTYGGIKPEIVVLGDSHALMWSGTIDRVCEELKLSISFYGCNGTTPFISIPINSNQNALYFSAEQKYEFDKKRLEYIKEWKPKIIIIVANWSTYHDTTSMDDLIKYIGEQGSKILFMEQPPVFFFGNKSMLRYLAFRKISPKDGLKQYVRILETNDYERGRNLLKQITAKYEFCETFFIADHYFNNKTDSAIALDSFDVLYIDDDHLSEFGANQMYRRIKDTLAEKINIK